MNYKNLKYFFFIFFLTTIFLEFFFYINCKNLNHKNSITKIYEFEKFNTNLFEYNSYNKVISYIEKNFKQNNFSQLEKIIFIDNFIKERFMHGRSELNRCKYWVLNMFDYIIYNRKYDLLVSNNVDRILNNKFAFCNQQAIVFQQIAKHFLFEYSSVEFNTPPKGHFASSIKVNSIWYYFDQHEEAKYEYLPPLLSQIINNENNQINKSYKDRWFAEIFIEGSKNNNIVQTNINTFPAFRGYLVQETLIFLSINLKYIFIIFIFYFFFKKKLLKVIKVK